MAPWFLIFSPASRHAALMSRQLFPEWTNNTGDTGAVTYRGNLNLRVVPTEYATGPR